MGGLLSLAVYCIGGPVLILALIPSLYRRYALAQVKKRREVTKFVYEEEMLASGKVRHVEEYVQYKNRTLYRQTWVTNDPTNVPLKGIMIAAHGLSSYSGKLAKIMIPFVEAGYVVIAIDLYGHGKSDGIHGYFPSVDYLVDDLHFHINNVKKSKPEYAKLPIFKFGLSLGGLLCLTHSVKYPTATKGMILFCPAVVVDKEALPPEWVLKLGNYLNLWFPEVPISARNRLRGFNDLAKAKKYLEDHRSYQGNNRSGSGIAVLQGMQKMQKNLTRVREPFLVVHGSADDTTHIDGSRMLVDKAQSKIKTFLEVKGANHMIHEEPQEVLDGILKNCVEWLDNFLKQQEQQ
eukprot:TRINITY_DN63128_c0_g1_i1.p1 TRINITY_DN63128_c0_g1~~TRINITY_DN63128_c0_g1_i1.p1  ORF type:complete len:348 (+),score=83.44 TRINITY_DN63128_c0_g1_i1:63-1106(+)